MVVQNVQPLRKVTNAVPKEKWDIFSGILIERLPIISMSLNNIETEYMVSFKINIDIYMLISINSFKAFLNQTEFENSQKSTHEINHEKELIQVELIKKGKIDVDIDMESTKQTAQDFEDSCTEEMAKFTFAHRTADGDQLNDFKNLDRKLEETLILLVNHKLGKDDLMLLPQGKWNTGETLRQTAERVVREMCCENLKVKFYGNSPCGFYKYKYPIDVKEKKDTVGAKVFFFRAAYKSGMIADQNKAYGWFPLEEVKKQVKEPYYQSLSQFVI